MNRRDFLLSGAALACAGCATDGVTAASPCCGGKPKFKLGIAGWTYHTLKPEQAYADMVKNDIHYLCVKDFFLPYDATDAQIKSFKAMLADRDIEPYGVGPHYLKTADELKAGFELCAKLGVPTYVGVPWRNAADGTDTWNLLRSNLELVALASQLADEYKIEFAIHNHGANPKYSGCPYMYPTAESIMKDIAGLSPRVGLCLDLAYSYADGFDGAELIRKYHDRLFDVHLRNTSQPDNGSSGDIAYRGTIDYRRVFRALVDVGYDRVCGLELVGAFEKRNDYPKNANPNWVPLSMGYFRGLMDAYGG
ncbi:MAG: sugar phosphate isomerase/epimerase family protein [Kiritimatiellia bacterium]